MKYSIMHDFFDRGLKSLFICLIFIISGCVSTDYLEYENYYINDVAEMMCISNKEIIKETSFEHSCYSYWGPYEIYQGHIKAEYGITKEKYERLIICTADNSNTDLYIICNYSDKYSLLSNYYRYENMSSLYDIKKLIREHYAPIKNKYTIDFVDGVSFRKHILCILS